MHGCHVSLHMSPLENMAMYGCHVSSQMVPASNQVELLLLLVMTINGNPITPSFLVRFGRFWARWKAYQEHNLALIPLLGSEARKSLQIFVQKNDRSGRCRIETFNIVEAPRIDDLIIDSR